MPAPPLLFMGSTRYLFCEKSPGKCCGTASRQGEKRCESKTYHTLLGRRKARNKPRVKFQNVLQSIFPTPSPNSSFPSPKQCQLKATNEYTQKSIKMLSQNSIKEEKKYWGDLESKGNRKYSCLPYWLGIEQREENAILATCHFHEGRQHAGPF